MAKAQTLHPTKCCPEHTKERLVLVTGRHPGAWYHRCPVEGCEFSWSDRDQRYFHPVLTQERNGKGLRYRVLLDLVGEGFPLSEVIKLLDSEDIRDVAALVAGKKR